MFFCFFGLLIVLDFLVNFFSIPTLSLLSLVVVGGWLAGWLGGWLAGGKDVDERCVYILKSKKQYKAK